MYGSYQYKNPSRYICAPAFDLCGLFLLFHFDTKIHTPGQKQAGDHSSKIDRLGIDCALSDTFPYSFTAVHQVKKYTRNHQASPFFANKGHLCIQPKSDVPFTPGPVLWHCCFQRKLVDILDPSFIDHGRSIICDP